MGTRNRGLNYICDITNLKEIDAFTFRNIYKQILPLISEKIKEEHE